MFEGCWEHDDVVLPVPWEDCKEFEESNRRVGRKYWEKWNWKVYVDGDLVHHEQGVPGDESLHFKRADEIHAEQISQGHPVCEQPTKCYEPCEPEHNATNKATDNSNTDTTNTNTNAANASTKEKETTRVLVLQALANSISKLKDIADFAGVDPSTAHYHLRNLVREQRVIKVSWGHYTFSYDQSLNNNGKISRNLLENNGKTFEKLLKNFSQSGRGRRGSKELHPVERNILMSILSKDNKYEQFSERELARKNSISRYMVKKYTEKLEKKKLITIKKEGKQYVYAPTELAIKGLTEFFGSLKNGSKVGSESSKVQPMQPVEINQSGRDSLQNQDDHVDTIKDPGPNVCETFDDYIAWQQKNAHRLFIQFKLLKCNHNRLKGTAWVFGKKSIHKHFDEAYIFKSKDPSGHIVNVLPKHPFIFESPFEFHDQVINFVNEIIDRLRDYGMIIDLSEPAEVRMQHVAIEDDPFARKIIEKKLLYFKSKVVTIDPTGETMEYVIAIDKSKKLHLEIEGREAQQLMENYEEFIDDVVTKRIDPKFLRELPEQNKKLKEKMQTIQDDQTRFDDTLNSFSETVQFYSENIKTHINALTSLTRSVNQSIEASKRIERAAESTEKAAKALIEAIELLKRLEESSSTYLRLLGGVA